MFSSKQQPSVKAFTFAENTNSQKVLEKSGFILTGKMIHENEKVMVYEL